MPRIAFYISSHGFGHATREIEVINNIPSQIEVEIITAVPQWLFDHSVYRPFEYIHKSHDIGLFQIDSTTPDIKKTLAMWNALLQEYDSIAKQEAERLLESNTSLVVGDISPMAVAAAKTAELPNVIIANFSWDWIFQPLVKYDAEFQSLIDQFVEYYRQCDLLIRTPLCGDLSVFPTIKDVDLIGRTAKKSREETRSQYSIDMDTSVFLLTFGGNQYPLPESGFSQHRDITFITFDEAFRDIPNVVQLNAQSIYHPDIVNMCDGVITKLGYGIVTECIAHDVPLAYPPRADFPEHEVMEAGAAEHIAITQFDETALKSGDWNFIHRLKDTVKKPESRNQNQRVVKGGEQAAQILQSMLGM